MVLSQQNTLISNLVDKLDSLRGTENKTVADILYHLAEVDFRGLYRDLGYSSLFTFCTERLGYSKSAAFRRVEGARMLKTNPEVYELISSGKLALCTVSELSKVQDKRKRSELLHLAIGKSKKEVCILTSRELPPESPKKEIIRARTVSASPAPHALKVASDSKSVIEDTAAETAPKPEHKMTLLSKTLYRFSVELDQEFMGLYKEAKELIGHVPASEIFKRVLKECVTNRKSLNA